MAHNTQFRALPAPETNGNGSLPAVPEQIAVYPPFAWGEPEPEAFLNISGSPWVSDTKVFLSFV